MGDEWKVPTLPEWMARTEQDEAKFRRMMRDGFTRGEWTYDPKTLTLSHTPSHYDVYLRDCITSAAILDWIVQARGKPDVTPESLGELIILLDDMLGLQQHYCGDGKEHGPVDAKRLLK